MSFVNDNNIFTTDHAHDRKSFLLTNWLKNLWTLQNLGGIFNGWKNCPEGCFSNMYSENWAVTKELLDVAIAGRPQTVVFCAMVASVMTWGAKNKYWCNKKNLNFHLLLWYKLDKTIKQYSIYSEIFDDVKSWPANAIIYFHKYF